MNRRLRWRAEIVEERLSNPDALAPLDFFNMSRATFLPCVASAFTYFIIIIQFKLSEAPPESISNSTELTNSTITDCPSLSNVTF